MIKHNYFQYQSLNLGLKFLPGIRTLLLINIKHDMVLLSTRKNRIIVIELTVPLEDRCGENIQRKELLVECRDQEWQTCNFQ